MEFETTSSDFQRYQTKVYAAQQRLEFVVAEQERLNKKLASDSVNPKEGFHVFPGAAMPTNHSWDRTRVGREQAALATLLNNRRDESYSSYDSLQSNSLPDLLFASVTKKRTLAQDDVSFDESQRKRLRMDNLATSSADPHQPIPSIEVSPKMTVPERITTPQESTATYDSTPTVKKAFLTADTLVPAIVFQRLPVSTQNFLRGVDMSTPGALVLARSVAELGARFGRIASEDQLKIGYQRLSQSPRMSVLFNALTPESKYVLFWKWVQEASGKYTTAPLQLKASILETDTKTNTPAVDTRLRTHLVKQIDARGPGALNDRVMKWMDNIIASH